MDEHTEELAPLRIPVTRTLVVAGAAATRDFQKVHHDPDAARERGSADVFLNILTTQGLVSRYLAERLGPAARLTALRIRLGVPAYPGDELELTGRVTPLGDETAEVTVVGRNSLGAHVTATATLVLP